MAYYEEPTPTEKFYYRFLKLIKRIEDLEERVKILEDRQEYDDDIQR